MCECRLFTCAILVLKIILVTGFNIDQLNYAVFGPVDNNKSMFGFTVAVHKDRGNRGWILVGAPEGQSKFQNPNIVQRGGTVYKCRSDTDDVCQQIPFDKTNNAGFVDVAIDEKSYQWFGATLSSSGRKDGPVVACAPRYIWFTKDLNRRDPVGTCYVSDGSFNKFEEYSPCRTMHWGYHRQGSCQAGFSAAINREGDRLFVGAPGSYYWQGQMYSIDAQAHFNYTPGYFGNLGYGSKGSVHQLSLENRPAVFSTREGKAPDDDSYIGYSTVVGHFQQGQKYEGIAVGMPRGNKLRGKVLLFTWDLVNYKNITISQQIGAYFGYSLAAADVNGDKKLDLIVGAPMHTDANTEDKYDVGRVYVFYQKNNFEESFSSSHFIDGTRSKGRFGHALASLGDLNQDGYDDFAVGAPYDGPNGRGAVYIYYGSKEGIRQKYGQVIYAETITGGRGYLTTFGFSLAGGLDLDDNEYPDMAVGAYLSDSAFFFRARPVVFVDSYVHFLTDYKKIDIRKKNCRLPNGQEGTCTSINFCIKYFGKGIPDQLALKVQYILDTKVKVPRMGFKSHGNHTFNSTVQLRKDGAENCHREEIYMKNEIRDKLTPLEAEVKFFMLEDYSYSQPRNPLSHLKPVLDLNNPPSRTDAILIDNDCGDDNICIPNLHVNITSNVKEYLLGSNTTLQFDVVVSNLGEDSFETTFEMWYPSEGIFYKKTDISIPGMWCTQSENKTVVCDIGNPLPSGKIAKFKVLFQPYYHGGFPNRSYVFDVFVNSSNPEPIGSLDDNRQHIEIPIWIDASLDIKGHSISSIQPLSHYNDTMYSGTINNVKTESEIGPQVTHVYYVENKGPSQVQHAEVYILWPLTSLKDDDALLYLLEQPHTMGNVTCDYVPYANYKHKQLDAQFLTTSIWDRLNIDISSFTGTKTVITESKATIEGKVTETGQGVSSGIGVINVDNTNINKEVEGGDSSSVFEKRYNESSSATNVQTWGTLNPNGEYEYTESKYFTVWENGRAVTRWENTTTIRDAHGNILRTLYHNDNTGSQSENNLNSLNYKLNLGQGEVQHLTARWFTTYGPNGEPITRWENRTIVKDLNGNILRSYIWDENRQEYRLETGSQTNTVQEKLRLEEQRRQEQSQPETRRLIEEQNLVEQRRQEEERRRTEAARREDAKRKEDERIRLEQKQKEEERIRIEEKRREEERIRIEEKRREEERIRIEEKRREEEKIRIEEKRREEERIRVEEEKRRRAEETRRNEERLRYEERRQEEERRRLEESRRQTTTRYPNSRYDEERRRVEERHRQEEERRRQQSRLELERRRQEQWRKQQEERRLEETRRLEEERKAEEERRRHQSGEVNGYNNWSSEEARRYYEERRRQESGGYDNKRIVTGYFDRDGKYHDASKNPNEFVFNKTFVVESSTTIPIDISGGQIHGIGNSNFDDLGSGFTVQTLDLGSGNTLDSRSSQESYSQRGRGSSNYNAQGSGSGQGGYRREWHSEGGYSTSGQIPPSYFQNSIEEDTVSSRSSRSRPKRQAVDPSDRTADIKALIKCNATNCIYIRCDIGVLDSNHEVIIALRSRLNVRALKSLVGVDQPIRLSSMMVASITELPYMEPIVKEKQILYKNEVFTDVPVKEADRVQEVAPLWIYIVSAVAGIVMLLLLIWLLSKCGFFKRNRPSPGPERQPLNRNGYHSGDEAL